MQRCLGATSKTPVELSSVQIGCFGSISLVRVQSRDTGTLIGTNGWQAVTLFTPALTAAATVANLGAVVGSFALIRPR